MKKATLILTLLLVCLTVLQVHAQVGTSLALTRQTACITEDSSRSEFGASHDVAAVTQRLRANTAPTETIVGGPITQDTMWDVAGSPYVATSSVLVMAGVTLTIEPGVVVKFDAEKALQVDGTLYACGIEAEPILFTAHSNTPTPGYWGYILFADDSSDATFDNDGNYTDGSALRHAIVEYGGYTSDQFESVGAVRADQSSPWIDQSTIQYNAGQGIHAKNTGLRITNNTIAHNRSNGVLVHNEYEGGGGQVVIDGNHIFNNVGTAGRQTHQSDLGGGGINLFENTVELTGLGAGRIINNLVEYNFTQSTGGGIFVFNHADSSGPKTTLIEQNIVRHNIAKVAGGIFVDAGANIVNNEVYDNVAYDYICWGTFCNGRSGGGGIYAGGITCNNENTCSTNISGNTIVNNRTFHGNGGGIFVSAWASWLLNLSNNTIANNETVEWAGGIYFNARSYSQPPLTQHQIRDNTIAFNKAQQGYGGVWLTQGSEGVIHLDQNSVVGNASGVSTPHFDTTICVQCDTSNPSDYTFYDEVWYSLNDNNFRDAQTADAVSYGFAQGATNLDATSNWWGTADTNSINNLIYDFFDDSDYAIVDYASFLDTPNPDAPVSPPLNLIVTTSDNTFNLTWDGNPEPDLAGYKVSYDEDGSYPHEGTGADQGTAGIDVGNVTNFAITGLPTNRYYYFTVTAYDSDGNESWYSQPVKAAIGEAQFANGGFELGAHHSWETENAAIIMSSALPDGVQAPIDERAAILGLADRQDSELSQVVHVPDNGGFLRFNYMLQRVRYSGGSIDHCVSGILEVRIDGQAIEDFSPYSIHPSYASWTSTSPNCIDTTPFGWVTREIDLSAYAGQSITLSFFVHSIGGNALLLDEVSIEAPNAPPTNTPSFHGDYFVSPPSASRMIIDGHGFPPNGAITLRVNGVQVPLHPNEVYHDFIADKVSWPAGIVPLALTTEGMTDGTYEVEVAVEGLSGTVKESFMLTVDSSAEEVPYTGYNNDYYFVAIPTDINNTVFLTSNHETGAPGSYFAITARNFSPNTATNITVNGQLVHSLNTNALGLLEFVMQTGVGMTPGLYEVRISDGRRVELGVMVRVDSNAPLRPNTSNAPIIEVPNTINPLHEIYIPIVIR